MYGLRNLKLPQRLLAECNLTFTKAFGLAQTEELSEQKAKYLQRSETMEVHVVNKNSRKGPLQKLSHKLLQHVILIQTKD